MDVQFENILKTLGFEIILIEPTYGLYFIGHREKKFGTLIYIKQKGSFEIQNSIVLITEENGERNIFQSKEETPQSLEYEQFKSLMLGKEIYLKEIEKNHKK